MEDKIESEVSLDCWNKTLIMDKPKVSSFYTIISAFFEYDVTKIDKGKINTKFTDWQTHIEFPNVVYPYKDAKSFNKFVDTAYYSLYCENMFPKGVDVNNFDNTDSPKLLHLTQTEILNNNPEGIITKKAKKDENGNVIKEVKHIPFTIEYADIYLFPDNTGVTSIKFSSENKDIENVVDLSFLLRGIDREINIENAKGSTLDDYIHDNVLSHLSINKADWIKYNPKYKTYTIIDFEEGVSNETKNNILFDIGNAIPYGSSKEKNFYHPSDEYFNEQMSNNKISVFNTWSALALFDTFTVLINEGDDLIHWEHENFQTYIHTLHMKFYMYVVNTKIKNVTQIDKNTEKLKNEFIEFINYYYHAKISYNFLPDLIHQKLIFALGVKDEMEIIERKILRINETAKKYSDEQRMQREIKFNKILFLIAILSIGSSVHDVSDWIVNLGVSQKIIFPWFGLGIIVLTSTIISVLIIRDKGIK